MEEIIEDFMMCPPQNTGHKTQDTRHKTQDTGHRTQDTGHRTQDTGHKTQDTRHRTQDTGHKTQDTGHRTQDTGHRTQDTGHRTQDTGHRTQDTGHKTHCDVMTALSDQIPLMATLQKRSISFISICLSGSNHFVNLIPHLPTTNPSYSPGKNYRSVIDTDGELNNSHSK